MSVRCLRGGARVLTGQSHLYTDTLTLHTEAAGSSFALFMKWCHYLLFYKHVCVHPRQACVHVCLHWWVKKIKTDRQRNRRQWGRNNPEKDVLLILHMGAEEQPDDSRQNERPRREKYLICSCFYILYVMDVGKEAIPNTELIKQDDTSRCVIS